MKKSIVCVVLAAALACFSAFAESMTKANITSNTEKFLEGKGAFVKAALTVENNNVTLYIPRESIKNIEIRENKGVSLLFIAADVFVYDEHIPCIGFGNIKKDEFDSKSLATPANDISLDSFGNLIIQKK